MNELDVVNKNAWSQELLKNVMLYPNEKVVAFLGRNYKNKEQNRSKNALDIGFGSGRHLKLLIDYGFDVHGIDYSEVSLETASHLIGLHPQIKNLSTLSIEELTVQDFYTVVVAYGVIFLREKDDIRRDLLKIHSILTENGKMIINFRTTEDVLYKQGVHVGGKSYILNDKIASYKDMLYTFFDLDEAKQLLEETGFKIVDIEREDYWKNNLSQRNSWWIFTVEKKK